MQTENQKETEKVIARKGQRQRQRNETEDSRDNREGNGCESKNIRRVKKYGIAQQEPRGGWP